MEDKYEGHKDYDWLIDPHLPTRGNVAFKNPKQFDQHSNTMYYPNPPKPSAVSSSAAQAYHADNPLTYIAFERLFWDTLVDLGWKAFDMKPDGKIEQIMLTCPECGKSIGKTQMVHTITKSKAHKISSPRQIEEIIRDHKKSAKGCSKPEYDENGDPVVEELSPVEALVKAITEES